MKTIYLLACFLTACTTIKVEPPMPDAQSCLMTGHNSGCAMPDGPPVDVDYSKVWTCLAMGCDHCDTNTEPCTCHGQVCAPGPLRCSEIGCVPTTDMCSIGGNPHYCACPAPDGTGTIVYCNNNNEM